MRKPGLFIVPLLTSLWFALLANAGSNALQAQTLESVEAATVKLVNVSPQYEFVGRVEAANSVDLLARVQGFIEQRSFQEGQLVTRNQPLYTIEKQGYQLALEDAEAAQNAAQVALDDATRRLARNQALTGTSVSQAALEESQAARDSAQANLQSATVRVSQAKLNLGYTTIFSPIEGRIGVSNVSVGSFVGNAATVLARVVEMDPIRVVFSVSDRSILDLRKAAGGASKDELAKRFKTTLRLSNGESYAQSGEVEFLDNQVDLQTGTLAVRALFSNPDALLVPNQFVTVVVGDVTPLMKPVVPQEVVQQDREGKIRSHRRRR